ncbi:hypothetical protein [Vibrio sp. D431a]|uniref:hypothetical protein n=1 Tax=Vibrio sp. D431a TaxID=2837388 RepID=UPI002552598F|nr:hypothetical protein [Vibrio sp. D431a]MDK9789771.1 hypothetical protein [Vibrio sp. D431a]
MNLKALEANIPLGLKTKIETTINCGKGAILSKTLGEIVHRIALENAIDNFEGEFESEEHEAAISDATQLSLEINELGLFIQSGYIYENSDGKEVEHVITTLIS